MIDFTKDPPAEDCREVRYGIILRTLGQEADHIKLFALEKREQADALMQQAFPDGTAISADAPIGASSPAGRAHDAAELASGLAAVADACARFDTDQPLGGLIMSTAARARSASDFDVYTRLVSELERLRSDAKHRWVWYAVMFVAGEIFSKLILPMIQGH